MRTVQETFREVIENDHYASDQAPSEDGMSVDVQEVFNKVIGAGFYGTPDKRYMCHALGDALEAGVISADECVATRQAIDEYMELIYDTGGSMAHALYASGLWITEDPKDSYPHNWCVLHGIEFYLNWANRPMPSRLHSQPETHLD